MDSAIAEGSRERRPRHRPGARAVRASSMWSAQRAQGSGSSGASRSRATSRGPRDTRGPQAVVTAWSGRARSGSWPCGGRPPRRCADQTRSTGRGERGRESRIFHPDPELEHGTRGWLTSRTADRTEDRSPTSAPARSSPLRQVLPERPRPTSRPRLPSTREVLGRVGVDGLVRPPVDHTVRLVVAVQVDAAQADQHIDRLLRDRGPDGTFAERHRTDTADVDRHEPGWRRGRARAIHQAADELSSGAWRHARHGTEDLPRRCRRACLDREVACVEPDQLGVRQVRR